MPKDDSVGWLPVKGGVAPRTQRERCPIAAKRPLGSDRLGLFRGMLVKKTLIRSNPRLSYRHRVLVVPQLLELLLGLMQHLALREHAEEHVP